MTEAPALQIPVQQTGCVHAPIDCDDGNASTSDLCSPAGCVNVPSISDNRDANDLESHEAGSSETQENSDEGNATTSEPQSVNETIPPEPSCDDGNPCTTDAYNGTICVYTIKNCDDENASTSDTCEAGVCVNEPVRSSSGNNSTIDSQSMEPSAARARNMR